MMTAPYYAKESEIMYLLLAELNAKPSCAREVESILRGLVDVARTEAGSVHYAVHRDKANPDTFVVYELYRDAAACDEHLASPSVKQALQRFESLLSTPPRICFCDLVAASDQT